MRVLAHRGLHRGNPELENTREAVESALSSTADGLEVDLQQVGDYRFVLHHDNTLDPNRFNVTHPRPLNSLTLDELREIVGEQLLTLEDVLQLDWQEKHFVFECKPSRNRYNFARSLVSRLSALEPTGEFTLSCSDPILLRELYHRIGSDVLAPVLSDPDPSYRAFMESNHWNEVHLREDLCEGTSPERKSWFPDDTIAWTVNDAKRRRELERIGIKGIMTDNSSFLP